MLGLMQVKKTHKHFLFSKSVRIKIIQANLATICINYNLNVNVISTLYKNVLTNKVNKKTDYFNNNLQVHVI